MIVDSLPVACLRRLPVFHTFEGQFRFARDHMTRWKVDFGLSVEQRKTKIEVVQHHMRGRFKACILNNIVNNDFVPAQETRYFAGQTQVPAENGCLLNLAPYNSEVFIPFPITLSADVPCRSVMGTSVQSQFLAIVDCR